MVDLNPIWPLSSQEEDIWTYKETPEVHTHRKQTIWGQSEKGAIYKPKGTQVSEKKQTLILDI